MSEGKKLNINDLIKFVSNKKYTLTQENKVLDRILNNLLDSSNKELNEDILKEFVEDLSTFKEDLNKYRGNRVRNTTQL